MKSPQQSPGDQGKSQPRGQLPGSSGGWPSQGTLGLLFFPKALVPVILTRWLTVPILGPKGRLCLSGYVRVLKPFGREFGVSLYTEPSQSSGDCPAEEA